MDINNFSKSLKFSILKFGSLALSKLGSGCGPSDSLLPIGSTKLLASHDFRAVFKYPCLGCMRLSR